MIATVPQYITDNRGKKISVILPIRQYKNMLDELEELEEIRLYDKAKSSKEQFSSAQEVFRNIDSKRRKQ